MKKKLIVTADDFGLTKRINEAIILAHRDGIVTSASLMTNGGAFESAVSMGRDNPSLDVGLHLNLTEGRPVSNPAAIPSLADSRGFLYKHPTKLARGFLSRKVNAADVETEIRAQLQKAMDAGAEMTHVDGHKHVHAIPPVLRALVRIAPEFGIRAIRSTNEGRTGLLSLMKRNGPARLQICKQYLSGLMTSLTFRTVARRIQLNRLVTPLSFYGVTQTGFLDLEALAAIFHDLPDGISELMCHPGYVDADLQKTPTRLLLQRERELQLLTGAEVRDLLTREKVELTDYKALCNQ
jgi:hopanoid biosynthesis associated protein HpnK